MRSPRRLEDKVCIVTGSSRGIGRAIALRFAQEGARLVITYHQNAQAGHRTRDQVAESGAEALLVQLEVTDRQSVRDMVRQTLDHFGQIDVLVNNAGWLQQKPFDDITDAEWAKALAVNLTGTFIATQEVAQVMKVQGSGRIVNMASMGGQFGGDKAPHYAAAKAGVICFTKSMARLLSPLSITVNAISPGFIRTELYEHVLQRSSAQEITASILLRRIGEPEEVAAAAVFLVSDEGDYITGQVINVNGGVYLG